jgi:type IV pilus assembly protein PilV
MKYRRKIITQKGFTLLEMLVAVTLIAIGLLATAAMQSVAINSNSIANRSTVVTALAQEVMEEIMSRDPQMDPQLRTSSAWVYDLEPTTLPTDRNVPSAGTYRISAVTTRPTGTNMNITTVSVTVTRVDNTSIEGRQGVRGSGAGGAFMLTDYKNVPN